MRRIKKRDKSEIHLFSATSIASLTTFITIMTVSGRPREIGIAFSGIMFALLLASNRWKAIPSQIHMILIGMSAVSFLGYFGYMKLNYNNSSNAGVK